MRALDKVCCPIGLGIGADTPQQIAVSVVAELMAARAGDAGRSSGGPLRPEKPLKKWRKKLVNYSN